MAVMIIQVFYICASDQCFKVLLHNTVEKKVRLIKASGQNIRLRHNIENYSSEINRYFQYLAIR